MGLVNIIDGDDPESDLEDAERFDLD
jgi:hypothetical protein